MDIMCMKETINECLNGGGAGRETIRVEKVKNKTMEKRTEKDKTDSGIYDKRIHAF